MPSTRNCERTSRVAKLQESPDDPEARIAAAHGLDAAERGRLGSRRSDGEIGTDQMPPLATERVDDDGVALLRKWIAEMPAE